MISVNRKYGACPHRPRQRGQARVGNTGSLLPAGELRYNRERGRFMSNPKEHAHELLDMLPEEKLTAVVGLLEVMVEPLSRSLASAPMEEEEITPDTATALERARASVARGEGIPHEDMQREFGS